MSYCHAYFFALLQHSGSAGALCGKVQRERVWRWLELEDLAGLSLFGLSVPLAVWGEQGSGI